MTSKRTAGASGLLVALVVILCATSITGCSNGNDSASNSGEDASTSSDPTVQASRRFVMAESDSMSLLDVEIGGPKDAALVTGSAFSREGSADDDGAGPREGFLIVEATAAPVDELRSRGDEIDVAGRTFWWISEGENQRAYAGSTPAGATFWLATLNVDEATAVELLASAEWSNDEVTFEGQRRPDGWVHTGNAITIGQFLAGATGSSAPVDGSRALYGDPTGVDNPTFDNIDELFGVTLATWPVTSDDPTNQARYSLDGEVEVEVRRADGSTTTGFSSPPDSEFFEFVVWQDGSSWLALSRPPSGDVTALIELAATVRGASPDEVAQLDALAAD